MTGTVGILTTVLAAGAALLLIAALFLVLLAVRGLRGLERHLPAIARAALPIVAAVSLAGSALTLLYSEVFGFIPCGLCWLERAMLYPSAIIAGVALVARDRTVFRYILALSLAGAAIALYHHALQIGVASLPCPSSGEGDCGKRLIFEFGFMTFPLMAFCIFAFNAACSYAVMRSEKIIG